MGLAQVAQPGDAWSKLTATVHRYRRWDRAKLPGRSRARSQAEEASLSGGKRQTEGTNPRWRVKKRRDEAETPLVRP